MMKHKKAIMAILIVILTSLLAYIGYCTIRYFIIWNKIEHSPIFYTLSDEEIEYFSAQTKLPLMDTVILSYEYSYFWNDSDSAELYISVSNENKKVFLEQVQKFYTTHEFSDTTSGFVHNGKSPFKWYEDRAGTRNKVFEFEEEQNVTVFGVFFNVDEDKLFQMTWDKIERGDK